MDPDRNEHHQSTCLHRSADIKRNHVNSRVFLVSTFVCSSCSSNSGQLEVMCTQNKCLIDRSIINDVNAGGHGWQADNYTMFWGKTLEEGLIHKLGTIEPNRIVS